MMSGIHKERTAAMEIGRYFCNDPAAPKPNMARNHTPMSETLSAEKITHPNRISKSE